MLISSNIVENKKTQNFTLKSKNDNSFKQFALKKRYDITSKLSIIHFLLTEQKPHTYIISFLEKNFYILSYVRLEDQAIVHVEFTKDKDGTYGYMNVTADSGLSKNQLIKRIMHYKVGQPKPKAYKI